MAIRADDDRLMALDAGSMSVFELTGELRNRSAFSETIVCDHPRIHPDGRWIGRWINDERADMSATYRRADGTEEARLAFHLLDEQFPGVKPGGFFFLNLTQARSYLYDFLPDGSVLWAASDELRVSVHADLGDEVFFEATATPVLFSEDEIAAMEEQQAELGPPLFMNVPRQYQMIHHLVVAESGEVWMYIKTQETDRPSAPIRGRRGSGLLHRRRRLRPSGCAPHLGEWTDVLHEPRARGNGSLLLPSALVAIAADLPAIDNQTEDHEAESAEAMGAMPARTAPRPAGTRRPAISVMMYPRVSRIDPGPRHLEVFAEICRAAGPVEGNFVHDCRIAAVMRENGIDRILTRDSSFRRIEFLDVVDPLGGDPFDETHG